MKHLNRNNVVEDLAEADGRYRNGMVNGMFQFKSNRGNLLDIGFCVVLVLMQMSKILNNFQKNRKVLVEGSFVF